MHLDDLVVRSLPFQKTGQKDYIDDTIAGLTLRVGKRTKTFMLVVGSAKARKRHTLGKYPHLSLQDARKKARILIGQREAAPKEELTDMRRCADLAVCRAVEPAAVVPREVR
jgi:hypothetical protein